MITLQHGDCLELMKDIPDESVDMILCDLPFGVTCTDWDKKINLAQLWQEYKRIIKEHGAIVLFSQLPFSCELIADAAVPFRYEWIWQKTLPAGFVLAHKMPMRIHENVLVFYKKLPTYNPQKTKGKPYNKGNGKACTQIYGTVKETERINDGDRFPVDVITFSNQSGELNNTKRLHPTQKPVPLLEYLIKTYTNPGDTVLDNTMGSGSTGVACVNTGRNFIGMELDDAFFNIASDRINEAINNG